MMLSRTESGQFGFRVHHDFWGWAILRAGGKINNLTLKLDYIGFPSTST
jgi:hypothetical protein